MICTSQCCMFESRTHGSDDIMADLPSVPSTPALLALPRSTYSGREIILSKECIGASITEDWPPDVEYAICTVGPLIKHRGKSYWVDGEWIHPHTEEVVKFRSRVSAKVIVAAINGDLGEDLLRGGQSDAVSGNLSLHVQNSVC